MFKCKSKSIFFLVMMMLPVGLIAQSGQICGNVVDAYSSEPLPDVNVILKGTPYGSSTNTRGYFIIKQIPVGTYLVQVSRIGFKKVEQEIHIENGTTKTLNTRLDAEAVKFREVLITATRERALNTEVTVATDIITRTEIGQTQSQNIGEILEFETNTFVKNYGNLSALKTASIRGASENQVLILLDGQRLNLAQGIAPDLGDIPLNAIERIEIIRGSHSALYGTDAIGGAINLITRSSSSNKALSGQFTSTFASFGTRILEANLGQKLGPVNYFLAHQYTDSEGDFNYGDLNGNTIKRTNNNLRWNNSFFKLGYNLNPTTFVTGYVQIHDAERGVPGPLNFPSKFAHQKDVSKRFNLHFDKAFSAGVNLQVQSYFYRSRQSFKDSSAFGKFYSRHNNESYGSSLQFNWPTSSTYVLTGGYEIRQDKSKSTDILSHNRMSHGIFLQNQISLPFQKIWPNSSFKIVPAGRLDKFTEKDLQFSPKLGFLYRYLSSYEIGIRGNWGRSYRLPSFNDLFWPADLYTSGNPELIPEEGSGYDFGINLNFKKIGFWQVEINYFDTQLNNLINWAQREDGVWSPQNIQKADISGIETRLIYQPFKEFLGFEAEYNFLDALDISRNQETNRRQLVYRPQHTVKLKLNLDINQFSFYWIWQYVSRRFSDVENTHSVEPYSISHLGWTWEQALLGGNLKLSLEIRNVFNHQFQIIEGYPVPGREYRTSIGFGI